MDYALWMGSSAFPKEVFVKQVVALVLSCFVSATAFAADVALEVGFRQQSGSVDATGVTTKSQLGYQLGASAFFPMNDGFGLRTGLFYVQRPLMLEDDAGTSEAKLNLNYFEIPLQAAYKFEDYASIFAGTALSVKLDDSVSGKTGLFNVGSYKMEEVKDTVFPIVVGASFMFAPQIGATLFFETIGGDVAKDLNGYRAVGANLRVTFE